jgi:hypothetical protein
MRESETVMSESEWSNFLDLVLSATRSGNVKFNSGFIRARVLVVRLGSCEVTMREEMGTSGCKIVFSRPDRKTRGDLIWQIKKVGLRGGTKWYIDERVPRSNYSLAKLAQEVLWQLSSFEMAAA